MDKKLQTVYVEKELCDRDSINFFDIDGKYITSGKKQSGFFFTPEELEKQKSEWQREAAISFGKWILQNDDCTKVYDGEEETNLWYNRYATEIPTEDLYSQYSNQ